MPASVDLPSRPLIPRVTKIPKNEKIAFPKPRSPRRAAALPSPAVFAARLAAMDGKRNGRVLAAALAISLALHTVLATFVHISFVEAQPYEKPPVITHLTVHPKPTPPPKPHSVVTAHHPVQSVRPQIQWPHVT